MLFLSPPTHGYVFLVLSLEMKKARKTLKMNDLVHHFVHFAGYMYVVLDFNVSDTPSILHTNEGKKKNTWKNK